MPKKTRKMKQRAAMRRNLPIDASPELEEAEEAQGAIATTQPTLSTFGRVATPATYDYSHIYSDLKRIALFAGFFFAVLIVLSFVIK